MSYEVYASHPRGLRLITEGIYLIPENHHL
jgi:hypothetical protein